MVSSNGTKLRKLRIMPTLALKRELILWNLTAQSQGAGPKKVIFFDPFDSGLTREFFNNSYKEENYNDGTA